MSTRYGCIYLSLHLCICLLHSSTCYAPSGSSSVALTCASRTVSLWPLLSSPVLSVGSQNQNRPQGPADDLDIRSEGALGRQMNRLALVLLLVALQTAHGLVQSKFQLNAVRRSQRLNTALPLPTQVFENAIRTTANPIAQQVKRIAFNWRSFIVMLAAVLTRFKSKIKSEVQKAASQMEMGWTKRGSSVQTL